MKPDLLTKWISTLAAAGVLVLSVAATGAADYNWTGSVSGDWAEPGNWNTAGGFPDNALDTATLAGANHPAVDLGGATRSVGALTFDTTASTAFSVGNGALNVAAGGSIVKAATVSNNNSTVSAGVDLVGDATFTNNNSWVLNAKMLQITGLITGSGTLTITGTGNGGVQLARDNSATFTGAVQIDSGMLLLSNDKALGDTATGTTVNGGELWLAYGVRTPEAFTIAGDSRQSNLGAGGISGDVRVNSGVTWTVDTGGGNALALSGSLSGAGNVVMSEGNITFSGSTDNTLSGTISHRSNRGDAMDIVYLSKTGGATAIAGDLELQNQAVLLWSRDHQVADTSTITLGGGTLKLNNHSETMGQLVLTGSSNIDLPGPANTLHFADSRAANWTGTQVLIKNWSGSATENVYVGSSASALTGAQLAKIGFTNPAGHTTGLYHAAILDTGEVVPGAKVMPANPPFDFSDAAMAAREAVYTSNGRAELAGAGTPLKAGQKISVFGDSITWLNGYVSAIQAALNSGAGTSALGVQVINRGINGGTAANIRDGKGSSAYPGSSAQESFANVIAADGSDIAVVYIGINDIWWAGTSESAFRQVLRDIADAAKNAGVGLVLATPSVYQERPDGANPKDAAIDRFSQITRDVAAEKNATLVDLREVYIAYEQNNNWTLELDRSLHYVSSGILTYDGVHPNSKGVSLLADHIAEGIHDAAIPEPATVSLLLLGGLALPRRRR